MQGECYAEQGGELPVSGYDCNIQNGDKYDRTIQRMADSAADAAYGERLRAALDKKQVLDGFAAGKTDLHFEFLRKRKDGELFWSRTNCRFHKHPASGDVIAFLYTMDVTEQRLQEQLLDKVTELDYEYIMEVNIRWDTYRMVSYKPEVKDKVPAEGRFQTAVRLVAERYMEGGGPAGIYFKTGYCLHRTGTGSSGQL